MEDDKITCILNAFKKVSATSPYALFTIEKVGKRQRIVLSIETNARYPSVGLSKKRKSPSTVHRNNERSRKYQEKKAGRNVASMPPPPPVTPSPPGPPLSSPDSNHISSRKRKRSAVSNASAHSEFSSVPEQSELMASPIPQLDGPPDSPAAPSDNVLEIQASDIPHEAIDVTRHDSALEDGLNSADDSDTVDNFWLHLFDDPSETIMADLRAAQIFRNAYGRTPSYSELAATINDSDVKEVHTEESTDEDQLEDMISLVKRRKQKQRFNSHH